MVPSGPSNPIGGAQSVPLSLLRSNSGMLAAQGGPMPSQSAFSSLVSPRNQYGNINFLGNVHNVSSLLGQSFGNVGPNSGLSGPGGTQRGGIESGAESDPLASVGNGIGFSPSSSSFVASNMANPCSSNQAQGQQFSNPSTNQIMPDQQQSQQLEPQNFQHCQQSPQANLHCNQPQQRQYQTIRGGFGSVGPVKQELQVTNDEHGQLQQLQSLRNLNPVKLEPQQMQATRDMVPVKMEPQQSDQSLFLQQQQQQRQQQQQHHSQQQHHHQQQQQRQQQQQQFLHMSRQSSQAAAAQINLLNHQRLLQMHQQQQQQLAKAIPQQRSQLPQPMPMRSPAKYEPGMCARRLTHYMHQQQRRPEDNNIDFWRKFVAEYFATNAKKKWCVSMYGSGRQTTGVFPQDVWHCEICNRKPGRGFEATVEVLPRLFKIKYESGTLEELLYVDMPHEHPNASGQIVLDYAKAIQESVFEQLRVVREGQLRIVFSPDLKICSWEFCARRHEELIPRRLLMPQVSQLGAAAQKYQAATQNASSNLSVPELQNNCNMFVASARQFAKALEVPLVNDLGYTKRYVRCLQISEVVNSMKDLIDYSRDTETGPMESLAKFPRRVGASSGYCNQTQQSEQQLQQQQTLVQKSNSDPSSVQGASVQLTSTNGMTNVNNSLNTTSVSTSASTIVGLLHQNSMNSRQTTSINNANSPYSGSVVQIPSPGSSSTIPQAQANPSPFQSPTPSSSNNLPQTSHSALTAAAQQPSLSNEGDPNDSQSSVQKIIHGMMMSTQVNGTGGMVGSSILGDDVKNVNVVTPLSNSMSLNGANSLMENGTANPNAGIGVAAFGSTGGGLGQSVMTNGIRVGMGNSSATLNWRAGMTAVAREQSMNHQSDLSNQLLGGLGVVNGFNNNQFDWKSSP